MKHPNIMLAILVATSTTGAWAQAIFPQTMSNQPSSEGTSSQSKTYNAGSMPYSSQTDYDGMGGIPQYRAESSNPSYIGVLGEKWETDKRGRRSTFIHHGQEMSVGSNYDPPKNEPEHRIQTTAPHLPSSLHDSLTGRMANLPATIKVGKPGDCSLKK